jgi:hypothetical protein
MPQVIMLFSRLNILQGEVEHIDHFNAVKKNDCEVHNIFYKELRLHTYKLQFLHSIQLYDKLKWVQFVAFMRCDMKFLK